MNITEITSTKKQTAERLRLAPYCRVSSDSTDQLHSFAAQIRYYSDYAKKHPEYTLVDIYADEGLTGTEMKKRDELNRLIADCKKGKVDRIIVKSVSRLARNTEELLVLLRMCKEIGVSVYFEEQGIDTEKLNMEMIVLDGIKNRPMEYDDQIVRQLLECVVVDSKEQITVIFKGGLKSVQPLTE